MWLFIIKLTIIKEWRMYFNEYRSLQVYLKINIEISITILKVTAVVIQNVKTLAGHLKWIHGARRAVCRPLVGQHCSNLIT